MPRRINVASLILLLLAAGCGGAGGTSGNSNLGSVKKSVKGGVHGGQSPICNSTISLVAAGIDGPCGSAVTDSNGSFTIDATCSPAADTQIYLVATGGVPNSNACDGSVNNDAIALSAVLGRFDSLPSFVTINEATTVASVWALNQFLAVDGQTPDPGTNAAGLANAARTVTSQNLVNVSTGLKPASFGPGVISPTDKLYTLANILAACVNTSSSSSLQCQELLCLASAGASFSGGCSVTPLTTTLEAALSIARNPANNVSDLFALPPPSSPFQPSLSSAPTDWLLAVTFSGIGG